MRTTTALETLLDGYRKRRAQMLDDIKVWRDNKYTLRQNNVDITNAWLTEQQRRADELGKVIAAYEKRAA